MMFSNYSFHMDIKTYSICLIVVSVMPATVPLGGAAHRLIKSLNGKLQELLH